MKKTQIIKDRLAKHRAMLEQLNALRQELGFVIEQFGSIGSALGNGMPRGSGGAPDAKVFSQVAKKTELEESIRTQQEELERDWEAVAPLVASLTPVESLVIRLRYYYGAEWPEICKRVFGKKSDYDDELDSYMNRVYKAHGRALLNLAKKYISE